jgi:hypothetical protein
MDERRAFVAITLSHQRVLLVFKEGSFAVVAEGCDAGRFAA